MYKGQDTVDRLEDRPLNPPAPNNWKGIKERRVPLKYAYEKALTNTNTVDARCSTLSVSYIYIYLFVISYTIYL